MTPASQSVPFEGVVLMNSRAAVGVSLSTRGLVVRVDDLAPHLGERVQLAFSPDDEPVHTEGEVQNVRGHMVTLRFPRLDQASLIALLQYTSHHPA